MCWLQGIPHPPILASCVAIVFGIKNSKNRNHSPTIKVSAFIALRERYQPAVVIDTLTKQVPEKMKGATMILQSSVLLVTVFSTSCLGYTTTLGTEHVLQFDAGEDHTCAVVSGGYLICFGDSVKGECGGGTSRRFLGSSYLLGNSVSIFSRVDLGSGKAVKQVAVGGKHTCALLDNNQIKCFGYNEYGQLGLGDDENRGDGVKGSGNDDDLPVRNEMGDDLYEVNVGTGRTVKQVVAGLHHTCVLLDNEQVKCFGKNQHGQLGLGDKKTRGTDSTDTVASLPTVDVGDQNVMQIVAGADHTCVLLKNRKVKCFGKNSAGQLGVGKENNLGTKPSDMGASLPYVDVGTGRHVLQVTAGAYHTCVLLDNFGVKCFGSNSDGQLGLKESGNRGKNPGEMGDDLPEIDFGKGSQNVKQVDAGGYHTCVVFDNNQMVCFGRNNFGQLGLGDTEERRLPMVNDEHVKLGSGRFVQQVVAGNQHTCALLDNNQLKCFGRNKYGQLGLGDTRDRGITMSDVGDQLPFVELGFGQAVKQVALGRFHTCVLLLNEHVKCFGYQWDGQLYGDDIHEMGEKLPYVDVGVGETVKEIVAGGYHTCVLLNSNNMKCFGYNEQGQLGLEDAEYRGGDVNNVGDTLPYVNVGEGRTVLQVSPGRYHTCVLLDNKKVKCFGKNNSGELGVEEKKYIGVKVGQMGDNLEALDFGEGIDVEQVATGDENTCVLLNNNQIKCFGQNFNNASKVGQGLEYIDHVDVGSNRTVKQLVMGCYHACVLLENNRIKCFGKNNHGQLGLGDKSFRGKNQNQMGDNLPEVDLGTGHVVKKVVTGCEHTCVLLEDGRVKCFGRNNHGQLGVRDKENRGDKNKQMGDKLESLQIGQNRTVKTIDAGGYHTCIHFENDRITCFGRNQNGQLGTGDSSFRKSVPSLPVELGFSTWCIPGYSFDVSQTGCLRCPIGHYQPLPNQKTCLACPVGHYQNSTGSTTCDACGPGTFENVLGSSKCQACDIGTFEDEFASTRCKTCPLHQTTLGTRSNSLSKCIAGIGFAMLAPNSQGIQTRSCNDIKGAECPQPGATIETLPLACGHWRSNPAITNGIQTCPGGCESCVGGDTGYWEYSSRDFVNSTKYCSPGYRGPRCSLCSPGYSQVFRDNMTCVECNNAEVEHAQVELEQILIAWVACIVVLTVLYIFILWKLNDESGSGCSKCDGCGIFHMRGCWGKGDSLHIRVMTLVAASGPPLTSAVSFYQVFNAYSDEFPNLSSSWKFGIDPVPSLRVSHRCLSEPTFRDRLLVHAMAPICLAVYVLLVTFVLNCCYKTSTKRTSNIARAVFVAMLPMVLVYPSLERRAVSAFVCEDFQTSAGTVQLLSADLRVDCQSADHVLTKALAYASIMLYSAIPLLFLYLWIEGVDDTRDGASEGVFVLMKRMFIFSSFRRAKGSKRNMGWFLSFDTIRKFCQASLIVFFSPGRLGQVQISTTLNILALSVAYKYVPYHLPGSNIALLIQLYLLAVVCIVVGFEDVTEPLGQWRSVVLFTIGAVLIPLSTFSCWMYNIVVLRKGLNKVSVALKNYHSKGDNDVRELRDAYEEAVSLGLKSHREQILQQACKELENKPEEILDSAQQEPEIEHFQLKEI